ncbi:LAMI_0H03576g1_1 [Lachancea mirantina]|uniref:LAMI_0H03576g1_1 n=1 Tax=Lachancea mirantina TaxID=1230905 RepID=A0A1G4KEB3_9SACH|nr:LAMI_0H03576g1_1 [Lachancea mirantina]
MEIKESSDNDIQLMDLRQRFETFNESINLEGKRCSWPYKVIPPKAIALLGFSYEPKFDAETNSVIRDRVHCVFCRCATVDFHDCRSKTLTMTLCNVLKKHLSDNSGCLNAILKLKIMETENDFDLKNVAGYNNPMAKNLVEFRETTFKHNWIHGNENENENSLSASRMANAGLFRYENSIDTSGTYESFPDATFCVYCTKVIASWENQDDPLWEHFKCSDGGECYFFQEHDNKLLIDDLKRRFQEDPTRYTQVELGLDYRQLFLKQIKQLDEELRSDETKSKRGRPRKVVSAEEKEAPKEVRKRGRPRKNSPDISNLNTADGRPDTGNSREIQGSELVFGPKRKRGRPRKIGTAIKLESVDDSKRVGNQNKSPQDVPPMIPVSTSNSNKGLVSGVEKAGTTEGIPLDSPQRPSELESRIEIKATNPETLPQRRVKLNSRSRGQLLDARDDLDMLDYHSNKSIVLNFKSRNSSLRIENTNPILDDSFDAFSFSTQGNSEFVIPESAFKSKSLASQTKEITGDVCPSNPDEDEQDQARSPSLNKSVMASPDIDTSKARKLDGIDMNINMSEDSDSEKSLNAYSSPVKSPITSVNGEQEALPRHDSDEPKIHIQNNIRNTAPSDHEHVAIQTHNDDAKSCLYRPETQEGIEVGNQEAFDGNSGRKFPSPPSDHVAFDESELQSHGTPKTSSPRRPASKEDDLTPRSTFVRRPGPNTINLNDAAETPTRAFSSSAKHTSVEFMPITTLNNKKEDHESSWNKMHGNGVQSHEPWGKNIGNRDITKHEENRLLLRSYLHRLLRYINYKDASLSNDKNGDLHFFFNKMPSEEQDLNFVSWLDNKEQELKRSFAEELANKMQALEEKFSDAKNCIERISDDETLAEVARAFSVWPPKDVEN